MGRLSVTSQGGRVASSRKRWRPERRTEKRLAARIAGVCRSAIFGRLLSLVARRYTVYATASMTVLITERKSK